MTTKLSAARVDEIENALNEFGETLDPEGEWYGYGGDGWYYWDEMQWFHTTADSRFAKGPVLVPGVGAVKVLESYTGGEGGGEDAELLFEIVMEDSGETLHFQKNGYYYSHDGTHWDGYFGQVQPIQVMRTEYVAVK